MKTSSSKFDVRTSSGRDCTSDSEVPCKRTRVVPTSTRLRADVSDPASGLPACADGWRHSIPLPSHTRGATARAQARAVAKVSAGGSKGIPTTGPRSVSSRPTSSSNIGRCHGRRSAAFQARTVASGSVGIVLSASLRLTRPRRGACNGHRRPYLYADPEASGRPFRWINHM